MSAKTDPLADAIARARADIAAGRAYTQEQVTALIAEMRRRQEGG